MKKLLEILSNPEKRMPIATLQKYENIHFCFLNKSPDLLPNFCSRCEDVLKKMNLPDISDGPDGGDGGPQGGERSLNPLLEAVLKVHD